MKPKTLQILFATLAMPISQAALIVTVDNADLDPNVGQFGSASEGGILAITNTIVDGAGPQNLTYTISGLNVDNVGVADDSVSITFIASTEGASLNSGADNSSQGFLGSGGSWLNADGDYVQLAFSSISVDLNGGTNNGAGTFLGFTELQVQSFVDEGDVAIINGVTKEYTNGDTSPFTIANEDYVKLEYQASGQDPASTGYRMFTWDFQFEAVPEPSSSVLLGIGALCLVTRRRK